MRETRLNQTELHVTPYEKHIMWRRRRSMLSGLAIRWEYNNFIPGRRLPPMIRRWYTLSSNTSWEERWCRHNLWYFFHIYCLFALLLSWLLSFTLWYWSIWARAHSHPDTWVVFVWTFIFNFRSIHMIPSTCYANRCQQQRTISISFRENGIFSIRD